MSKTFIPENYESPLSLFDTQMAIEIIKRSIEKNISKKLKLTRVTAPLFVGASTGLNDDLSGVERAVSFDILETKTNAQVVHSLAKWKRIALYKYNFPVYTGIYTNMNAIRRDEEMTNSHSIYVDQWDWEKIITPQDRNKEYLKQTVIDIVDCVYDTLDTLKLKYPQIKTKIKKEVSFVTTQELEDMYPDLSPKQREDTYLKIHKTAFIMQIGDLLKSGKKHDNRAPDYDDWQLNGDIMLWNDVLGRSFEISSMGIRVDSKTLDQQLTKSGCDDRRSLPFHKMLLEGRLPLTIGGGIGQSRVCMILLGKCHVGEVQVSIWDDDTLNTCAKHGVQLL